MEFYSFYKRKSPDIVYIDGEDDYLKNMAVAKIKCDSAVDDIDVANLVEPTVDNVVSEIVTVPFLGEKRLIVVREFYPEKEDYSYFISQIQKNKDYVALVIINSKPLESLKKEPFTYVNCDKSEDFAREFVADYLGKANLSYDYEIIMAIVDYCSCNMAKIVSELGKLSAYCQEKGRVDIADVDLIVTKDLEYKFYELSDYVSQKNYNKAYAIVSDMFSKNEPPQKLFTFLYKHFRRLLYCKLNKDKEVVAKALGDKELTIKKAMQASAKFNALTLKKINERFYEYDFAFKSGRLEPKNAIWLAIFGVLFTN